VNNSPLNLSELLYSIPGEKLEIPLDVSITGIAMDSRKVGAGDLFIAITGENTDGHRFIPDAIRQGASAVVGTRPLSEMPVPYIKVTNARRALAYLSAAWHGYPARKLVVIGITGTDGKTTTANLIYHILQAAGLRVGMISTVNAVIGDKSLDTGFHVTTPEAPDVQKYLSMMVEAGLTHVILEATSHGLAQERVTACDFDIGIVTNITHEHLDYHGSYEEYRAAKGRLFTSIELTAPKPSNPPRAAVLNLEDGSFDYLSGVTKVNRLIYGKSPGADVRSGKVLIRPDSLRIEIIGNDLHGREFSFWVNSNLIGEFNVANILAAVTGTRGVMGLTKEAVQKGIATLKRIPGRMERLDLGQDFIVIVDFAHTPNALRRTFESARELTTRQLIVVFGSAGLRDREKRRLMAEISVELADLSILTAEDPRTESLADILSEMAAGVESLGGREGRSYWRVPDRRDAIRFAISLAKPGDLVIVCGKGHEQSMCFGEMEYAWDDRTAMRAALSEHLGIPGPEMPFLPSWE